MTDKRATAKRFAQHYFALIAQAAGVNWDSDNRAEIDDLIDLIIDAAKDEGWAEAQKARKIFFEYEQLREIEEVDFDELPNRLVSVCNLTHEEAQKWIARYLEPFWTVVDDDEASDEGER